MTEAPRVDPELNQRQRAALASRERFLEAGLDLIAGKITTPVRAVRATDVAAAAGLTTGAFYHHWSTQEEYRDELRRFLSGALGRQRDLQRFGDEIVTESDDLATGILDAVTVETARLAEDSGWLVQLAMVAAQTPDDLVTCRAEYDVWLDDLVTFYRDLVDAAGYELRPGFTYETLARIMMALAEGFALQFNAQPAFRRDATAPRESGAPRTAIDQATAALLTSALQRSGASGQPTLQQTWNELFAPADATTEGDVSR